MKVDISGNANLVAFVRYEQQGWKGFSIVWNIVITTAEAFFNILNNFVLQNKLEWVKCVGISTDGAQAMTGKQNGLFARVQAVGLSAKWTHCSIRREALALHGIPSKMKDIFD